MSLSLLSSIKSSAMEKFSTWSPLGSSCLVLQQVIRLHELPLGLQSLGSTGQVEGIGVSVQQVLEGLQGRLAG